MSISCRTPEKAQEFAELLPVFQQCSLKVSDSQDLYQDLEEIEAADTKFYAPINDKIIFLKAASPTSESEGMVPRYWLRVEDYETVEKAQQRAAEYTEIGSIETRASKDDLMSSKKSVRIWAIARGKRVYTLTTNVSLFTKIETPKKLRKAIELLPET